MTVSVLSSPPPLASKPFFHSSKVTVIKCYNLSLTTRMTINSHDLRQTNHLGGGRESILCIVVHFQPVIKLLQKVVKSASQPPPQTPSGEGDTPSPHPTPRRFRRLDLNPLHSEILPTLLRNTAGME